MGFILFYGLTASGLQIKEFVVWDHHLLSWDLEEWNVNVVLLFVYIQIMKNQLEILLLLANDRCIHFSLITMGHRVSLTNSTISLHVMSCPICVRRICRLTLTPNLSICMTVEGNDRNTIIFKTLFHNLQHWQVVRVTLLLQMLVINITFVRHQLQHIMLPIVKK